VPVDLYAIYPDGSCNLIGTAVTEPLAGGIFSFAWTPPAEGVYTIMAVFNGDESYGSSFAGTSLLVVSPGPVSATAEQAETLRTSNVILAVLVVVAIVIGLANLYIVRKK
jgi:hypothetical protein